jgi:hypothetical protein
MDGLILLLGVALGMLIGKLLWPILVKADSIREESNEVPAVEHEPSARGRKIVKGD